MKKQYYQYVHISVGILMLLGLLAFVFLAIKVSGFSNLSQDGYYTITAEFSNIGGLKNHAPITVSGVKVGEVTDIELIPNSLNAQVRMLLRKDKPIPYDDATARILTEGLLGSNYISIIPGFDNPDSNHPFLREGDTITKTQEALVLENLIGQLVFNIKK